MISGARPTALGPIQLLRRPELLPSAKSWFPEGTSDGRYWEGALKYVGPVNGQDSEIDFDCCPLN
jgi:hypothetical protein